jgi:stage II sporulation protein D
MRVRSAPTAFALLTVAALASTGAAPAPAAPDPAPGWVVDRVRFEPVDGPGGILTAEGVGSYRGAIEIVPGPGGLAVVNDVGLQDYLKGIAEVPPEWPVQALRAQVIAARTYALHSRNTATGSPWKAVGADICATQDCQVYVGTEAESRASSDRWAAAVDATAGQVLLSGGEPILAMYSASNGGRSLPGGKPYLRAVNDPDDARSGVGRWSYSVLLSTLAPVLNVPPALTIIGVSRRGATVVFAVKDANGVATEHQVGSEDFRARANGTLGSGPGLSSAIPSTGYSLSTAGDSAVIAGQGFGHGIGMSQWGAKGKADRGLSASQILAAYYGGIRPTTVPPDQLPATIRVAMAYGRGAVTVRPERSFRVVAGSGEELGGVEVGRWRLQAAAGGVRVIPPEGRNEPLSFRTATVERPEQVTEPPVVRYDLTAPAVVTIRYVTPTGQPGTVPAQVVDPGGVAQPLPLPGGGGDYQVVIEADGGPGRFVTVPLHLEVEGPSRITSATFGGDEPAGLGRAGMIGLAVLLLAGMGLANQQAAHRRSAGPG